MVVVTAEEDLRSDQLKRADLAASDPLLRCVSCNRMVHNIVDGMAKLPYEERYDTSLDEYVEDRIGEGCLFSETTFYERIQQRGCEQLRDSHEEWIIRAFTDALLGKADPKMVGGNHLNRWGMKYRICHDWAQVCTVDQLRTLDKQLTDSDEHWRRVAAQDGRTPSSDPLLSEKGEPEPGSSEGGGGGNKPSSILPALGPRDFKKKVLDSEGDLLIYFAVTTSELHPFVVQRLEAVFSMWGLGDAGEHDGAGLEAFSNFAIATVDVAEAGMLQQSAYMTRPRVVLYPSGGKHTAPKVLADMKGEDGGVDDYLRFLAESAAVAANRDKARRLLDSFRAKAGLMLQAPEAMEARRAELQSVLSARQLDLIASKVNGTAKRSRNSRYERVGVVAVPPHKRAAVKEDAKAPQPQEQRIKMDTEL
jgi:hypothetical protein